MATMIADITVGFLSRIDIVGAIFVSDFVCIDYDKWDPSCVFS